MNIQLTAREREVAQLVAEGLTNREIAERLVISERTAEGHVEQIRNKLGFHSRSQVAAWAVTKAVGVRAAAAPSDRAATLERAPGSAAPAGADAVGVATVAPQTLTFLFADLRDYTRFVERHGDAAATVLIADYRHLVRAQVAGAGGGEIKTEGDSFYVVFPTARQALACAAGILRGADAYSVEHPDRAMRVGIGVHAGEPVPHEGQYVGAAVIVAARLAQNAAPGELLVSEVVRGLVRTSGIAPMRERPGLALKGVRDQLRIYAIDWQNADALRRRPRGAPWPALRTVPRRIIVGVGVIAIALLAVAVGLATRPAPAGATLVTIAGLGTAGFSGDGGPATVAQLDRPIGLVFDRAGDLYVADFSSLDVAGGGRGENFTRIRRIGAAGTIRTVAGDGAVDARDGEFASAIRLHRETYLAVDGTGAVYLTGASALATFVGMGGGSAWVAKLSDGKFTIIAGGSASAGYSGDGGPALRASLGLPRSAGIAVDTLGNVFVADSANERIRMVARDGTISTVAGTGERGFSGDGGRATAAAVFGPVGLAVSPDGSLYIADTNNQRIRKIDHSGNMVTVAGNGSAGYGGDGGPARDAQLNLPLGLAFDRAGNLYVSDSANNRIRRVDMTGVISTVAGDGGAEQLLRPSAVALDASGVLYIADTGNHRIRKLVRS